MYNNYGYNPYYQPQRFQNVDQQNQQSMMTTYQPPLQLTKPTTLLGKSVDNIDVVKATDIPLDGSISYFPLTDGSAIVTKQLQMDGTSKTIIYKPVKEEGKEEPQRPFKHLLRRVLALGQRLQVQERTQPPHDQYVDGRPGEHPLHQRNNRREQRRDADLWHVS